MYYPGMASPSTPSTSAVILEALLTVVDEQGLDRVTVREVAREAGVSIGAVQHHFPTKEAMVSAAFAEVVRRIRERVAAHVAASDDVRANLRAVLHELLPLDERRRSEARVQVAFAARAATAPALAELQGVILAEVRAGLAEAFAALLGQEPTAPAPRRAATVALALVDGLAQHAVSVAVPPGAEELVDALEVVLVGLVA